MLGAGLHMSLIKKMKTKLFFAISLCIISVIFIPAMVVAMPSTGLDRWRPVESTYVAKAASVSADCTNLNNCKFMNQLKGVIKGLGAGVGVVVVISVVVGGIQYSAARDNPQAVAAARKKISNAVLALVLYLFGFAFLQWLIPGGIV